MSWKGLILTGNTYSSFFDEVKDLCGGVGFAKVLAKAVDDGRKCQKPTLIEFTATGGTQDVAHGLSAAPAAVSIASFRAPRVSDSIAPTEVIIGGWTATNISVTSVAGTVITLNVYPSSDYK